MTPTTVPTVQVRLLTPVSSTFVGGRWNAGEEVSFPQDIAEDLIARGAAIATAAKPAEAVVVAALDHSPSDTMIHRAPVKKGR